MKGHRVDGEPDHTMGRTSWYHNLMAEVPLSAADKGSILMKQQLADIAGKEVTVLTVDYAPGAVSEPHVHPGSGS